MAQDDSRSTSQGDRRGAARHRLIVAIAASVALLASAVIAFPSYGGDSSASSAGGDYKAAYDVAARTAAAAAAMRNGQDTVYLPDGTHLHLNGGKLTGGPPAGGESTDVLALVSQLRRPESVQVVGETDDPHTYCEAADVIIVPSDDPEPFGLVAAEAFARGRAVVGSDAGGLSDMITEGVTGWLFPSRAALSLATVLDTLTREVVTAAGSAARTEYLDRFTTARFAQDW